MAKQSSWLGNRTYRIWYAMKARCNNPNHTRYEYYGAKGIRVCRRWYKFFNFLADMGPVPPGMTIERKDGKKGYRPDNCRWATMKEQSRNKRNNRYYEINGEKRILSDWCKLYGVPISRVWSRLQRGLTIKDALTLSSLRRGGIPRARWRRVAKKPSDIHL